LHRHAHRVLRRQRPAPAAMGPAATAGVLGASLRHRDPAHHARRDPRPPRGQGHWARHACEARQWPMSTIPSPHAPDTRPQAPPARPRDRASERTPAWLVGYEGRLARAPGNVGADMPHGEGTDRDPARSYERLDTSDLARLGRAAQAELDAFFAPKPRLAGLPGPVPV